MRVILTKDVPNLGDEGDVVKVAAGYFRNYLSPRAMAILSTRSNLKELEFKKKRIEKVKAERRSEAEKLAGKIQNLETTVRNRCGEKGQLFGSVTSANIAEAMAQAGYEIDRRKILITHPIKQIGEHEVTLRIYTGVNATIKVFVKPEEDQEEQIYEALAKTQRQEEDARERARKAAELAKRAARGETEEAAEEAASDDAEASSEEAAEEESSDDKE